MSALSIARAWIGSNERTGRCDGAIGGMRLVRFGAA
jgi:hypothetical protein